MEEENLIPGAWIILRFVEACASGIDSLCQWTGTALPSFLTENIHPLVLAAITSVNIIVWLALNYQTIIKSLEPFFKIAMPWYHAAFLLGWAAAYPFEHKSMGFFGWLYFSGYKDTEVTWVNYREWDGLFQLCLVLIMIGSIFLGIVFFIRQGPKGMIGALSGFSMFFFIGYSLMSLRAWICIDLLRENSIAWLLNMLMGVPEVVFLIMLALLFVVFFTSPASIHAYAVNAKRKEQQELRKNTAKQTTVLEETFPKPAAKKTVFPAALRSPKGETYRLSYENGERAEYLCRRTADRVSFHRDDFEDGYPTGWNAY